MEDDKEVILGRFGAVYGLRGWLKVISFTQPVDNILNYSEWQVQHHGSWKTITLEDSKIHGKGIIVKVQGIDDPDQARLYINNEIAIDREALPKLSEEEHYWRDLMGLTVITKGGVTLGTVKGLLETGANDVLIVQGKRERMIPYTDEVVISIDQEKKMITVDWDPEF